MRWTSLIKIDSFDSIINSIKSLNEEWYLSKKAFFLKESDYKAKLNKIIVLHNKRLEVYMDEDTGKEFPDVLTFDAEPEYYTLLNYCWNSHFEGSLANNNVEIIDGFPSEIDDLPLDCIKIHELIIEYFDNSFKDVGQLELKVPFILGKIDIIKKNFNLIDELNNDFKKIKEELLDILIYKIEFKYKNWIDIYNQSELKTQKKQKRVKNNNPLSINTNHKGFNYKQSVINPVAINNVFKSLIKEGYIDANTKASDFNKVFMNKPITDKIIWKGDINALTFFIKTIVAKGKIDKLVRNQKWNLTKYCFRLENNVELTNDQLRLAKKPASWQQIERIIDKFE